MSKQPRQLAARIDERLARNLETLAPTGLNYAQIVKESVDLFTRVYQVAVEQGIAEPTEIPTLTAYKFRLPPRPQPPRMGAIQLPDFGLTKEP